MSDAYSKKLNQNDQQGNREDYPVDLTAKRSYDMYQVAGTIQRVTRPIFKEQAPNAVQIISDWVDIIGSHYGQRTHPRSLVKGVLTIACSSTTAAELHYVSQNIIQKINLYCGREVIQKLKFLSTRSTVISLPKKPSLPKVKTNPVEIKSLPPSPLQEALSRLGGHLQHQKRGQ